MSAVLNALVHTLTALPAHHLFGRVTAVQGLLVEAGGLHGTLSVGDRVALSARASRQVLCEVVGFRAERVLLMPFEALDGVGLGTRAEMAESAPALYPTKA
ncbi:MAG: flagellum-specific ATP synthase [Rhodospirillaceae bacterium]|nr:MAG: flagellum-specific ATP synthase [Rhodospirillaceae bacterium]